MRAIDFLSRQRNAARELAKHHAAVGADVLHQGDAFTARLCDELIRIINPDAVLNKAQAEFVGLTVSNVGYQFLPGQEVKYHETPATCVFLLMQLAGYINSCK